MSLANSEALCTLDDLKDDLGITDAASDARLERRILVASDMIKAYLRRPLRRIVDHEEALPGYGTDKLFPSLTPIESVSSVEDDGDTVAASSYSVDESRTMLVAQGGWRNTALGFQTVAAAAQMVPGTEREDFLVTYTGGYWLPNDSGSMPGTATALPPAITEACLRLAATLHGSRGRDGTVQSEQAGNASIQYRVSYEQDGSVNGIPKAIADMLRPWRRAV